MIVTVGDKQQCLSSPHITTLSSTQDLLLYAMLLSQPTPHSGPTMAQIYFHFHSKQRKKYHRHLKTFTINFGEHINNQKGEKKKTLNRKQESAQRMRRLKTKFNNKLLWVLAQNKHTFLSRHKHTQNNNTVFAV